MSPQCPPAKVERALAGLFAGMLALPLGVVLAQGMRAGSMTVASRTADGLWTCQSVGTHAASCWTPPELLIVAGLFALSIVGVIGALSGRSAILLAAAASSGAAVVAAAAMATHPAHFALCGFFSAGALCLWLAGSTTRRERPLSRAAPC